MRGSRCPLSAAAGGGGGGGQLAGCTDCPTPTCRRERPLRRRRRRPADGASRIRSNLCGQARASQRLARQPPPAPAAAACATGGSGRRQLHSPVQARSTGGARVLSKSAGWAFGACGCQRRLSSSLAVFSWGGWDGGCSAVPRPLPAVGATAHVCGTESRPPCGTVAGARSVCFDPDPVNTVQRS